MYNVKQLIEEILDSQLIEAAHTKSAWDLLYQASLAEASEIAAAITATLYPAKSIIISVEPGSLVDQVMAHVKALPILTKIAVATAILESIGSNEDEEDEEGEEDDEDCDEDCEDGAELYAEYLAVESGYPDPIPY